MAQIQRLPYLTPLPDRIRLSKWEVLKGAIYDPLDNLFPDWDPAIPLNVRISITVDIEGIIQDCALNEDAKLRVAVLWNSSGTMLRGCGGTKDLHLQPLPQEILLSTSIEGINLAQDVEFLACLVLTDPGSPPYKPFSAKIIGCALWRSNPFRVYIEGQGPRFPMEVISFKDTPYDNDAGWALMWDLNDLHLSVTAGVRLYINSSHDRIKRAVSENRPEDFDIREAIRYDVARSLIYGALKNEEFVKDPNAFVRGTLGYAVRSFLEIYFQGYSTNSLYDLVQQPSALDHMIQANLKIFKQAN